MRKFYYALIFSMIVSLFLAGNVLASEEVADVKKISENLTVEFYSDGRVAPIEDPLELTETELNQVLFEIGYSMVEIDKLSTSIKRELVSYGGKVLEGEIVNYKHSYVTDGKKYEITPKNKDKIRELQSTDLKKRGVDTELIDKYVVPQEKISIMSKDCTGSTGNCSEGTWSAGVQAVKVGETNTQLEYMIFGQYLWSKNPIAGLGHGDNFGLHWGGYGQPADGSAYSEGASRLAHTGEYHYYANPMNLASNYGIKTEIKRLDKYGIYNQHSGSLMEVIRISKSAHEGDILTISAAYSHPWTANDWDISIGYGVLEFTGLVGLGDEWTWRYNFTAK